MVMRRDQRCNQHSETAAVDVFNPSEIQDDSLVLVEQVENYAPELVWFSPKDNPATAPNDRNVFSSRDV